MIAKILRYQTMHDINSKLNEDHENRFYFYVRLVVFRLFKFKVVGLLSIFQKKRVKWRFLSGLWYTHKYILFFDLFFSECESVFFLCTFHFFLYRKNPIAIAEQRRRNKNFFFEMLPFSHSVSLYRRIFRLVAFSSSMVPLYCHWSVCFTHIKRSGYHLTKHIELSTASHRRSSRKREGRMAARRKKVGTSWKKDLKKRKRKYLMK